MLYFVVGLPILEQRSVTDSTFLDEDQKQQQQSLLRALQRVQELEKQLANAIKEKQRATETEEELAALKTQLISLRDLYEKARDQIEQQKRIIAQLSQQQDKQERERNIQVSAKQTELQGTLAKEKESLHKLREEADSLQRTLADSQQHNKQLERVIQFLRERAEESHLEAKQLREEFQTNRELVDTLSKQSEAKDQELKMAQHHLAKKMKETVSLSEKNEELVNQLQSIQRELAEAHNRATVAQQSLGLQQQREQQLQELLENNAQATDAQIKKWEEKYFHAYEKWQEAEAHSRLSRSLEEKLYQVQNIASNLTAILGQHPTRPHGTPNIRPQADPMPSEQPKNENNAPQMRYKQTLFD